RSRHDVRVGEPPPSRLTKAAAPYRQVWGGRQAFVNDREEWDSRASAITPHLGLSPRIHPVVRRCGRGTTTRGVVQVDVPDVPAGGSASWNAGLPIDDDGLSVVLRVERAAAEG